MPLLNKDELKMLDKMGFTLDSLGNIVKKGEKEASENYTYCGFQTYITSDGALLEKMGNELIEIFSQETAAEQRFVKKHLQGE